MWNSVGDVMFGRKKNRDEILTINEGTYHRGGGWSPCMFWWSLKNRVGVHHWRTTISADESVECPLCKLTIWIERKIRKPKEKSEVDLWAEELENIPDWNGDGME